MGTFWIKLHSSLADGNPTIVGSIFNFIFTSSYLYKGLSFCLPLIVEAIAIHLTNPELCKQKHLLRALQLAWTYMMTSVCLISFHFISINQLNNFNLLLIEHFVEISHSFSHILLLYHYFVIFLTLPCRFLSISEL